MPPDVAAQARARLDAALATENIGLTLLPNAEHHLFADLLFRAEAGTVVPIGGGTRWLLVEPPWTPPAMLDELIFRLQARGLRLLLAHPERYNWLGDARLAGWVDKGVRVQAELGSFVGFYGELCQRRVMTLVEQGLVHVLATDLHRPQDLEGWVAAAIYSVEHQLGRGALVRAMSDNPAAILADAAIADIQPLVM